uniref:Uncharacterized protein n=1 Tax=Anopheles minimus TaxID=112268 RepID=A0A182W0B9_9DIPT
MDNYSPSASCRAAFVQSVRCPSIGIALVPYYRQLLPTLNLYKQRRVNTGDRIDFRGGRRIGDVVNATLEMLEQCGGPDAYLNIKYMVPTYESCVYNR